MPKSNKIHYLDAEIQHKGNYLWKEQKYYQQQLQHLQNEKEFGTKPARY